MADPLDVLARLTAAQNAHDADAMAACLHDDYRSEQPLHPSRDFVGAAQLRANWTTIFGGVDGFRAEVLRAAVDHDTVFAEVRWTGMRADDTVLDQRGVLIFGVRDDRIAWARIYVGDVEDAGAGIEAVVRRMTGIDEG